MKYFFKLFQKKHVPLSVFEKLISDIVLFNISTLLAVWMRFDYTLKLQYLHIDDLFGISENVIFIVLDILFKLPFQAWEYTSIKEISDTIYVITLTKIFAGAFLYAFRPRVMWSRGAYLISWVVAILLLSGIRLFVRVVKEKKSIISKRNSIRGEKSVLIIGAGDAGEKIIREILARPDLNYRIIGILDDDPRKKGRKIHGYTVLGGIERLPHVVNEMDIDIVLVAVPSASKEFLRKVVSLASNTKAEIKTLPGIWEIIDGRVTVSKVRNVKLEDLLSRPSVKTDTTIVESYIKNATILITGAGGSIGSEIVRQVSTFAPKKIILLDKSENGMFRVGRGLEDIKHFNKFVSVVCDIRNREKVFKIFEKYHPDVVFHTAAHKHVPLMEDNPDESVTNNIFGTKNLLDAAIKSGVKRFVNISTDKAVNPTSIMGASKRVIEMMLQLYAKKSSSTIFTSVRFGNVLGSAGSVIEVFKKQLNETGVLTVTDPKMKRYFMLIPEAVQLVLQAGALGKGGEIFVLKMGKPVNIMELAKTFAKLSGFEVGKDVKIKIIGNRGGEKLVEELWSKNETIEDTVNPYVWRIKTNGDKLSEKDFFVLLDKLNIAAKNMDFRAVRGIFKKIIPEAHLDEI